MQTKTCSKCGIEKATTEFYKNKNGKYGVQGKCRNCENTYRREWRKLPEVQEKERNYARRYRQRSDVKKRELERSQKPENRKKKNEQNRIFMREYSQRPEVKEKRREYLQRPEVQSRYKALSESPARREYGREYMRRKREMGIKSTTQYIEITEKYATRSGKWSDAEVQFLMSSELSLVDIAMELGRTYRSVELKRWKVRKKLEAQQ